MNPEANQEGIDSTEPTAVSATGYSVARHRDQCPPEENSDSQEEPKERGSEEEASTWAVETYQQDQAHEKQGAEGPPCASRSDPEAAGPEEEVSEEDEEEDEDEESEIDSDEIFISTSSESDSDSSTETADLDKCMQARFVQWQSNILQLLRSDARKDREEGSRAIALTYRRRREQGGSRFYSWQNLVILESELARAAPNVLTLRSPATPEASRWDAVLDELRGLKLEDEA
ncbi:putative phosphoprotein [Nyavirus midwayense]|uniref:Putative phosphoprotein n=1 Tax=Nyavirus midwayense TaxID=644609 RepID=C4NFL3_9MONO|nr:putative phosphoprotein [Nyavirus midwayense]ACQ94975.1 putative phosphoprotein [Nyavirus midwayense]